MPGVLPRSRPGDSELQTLFREVFMARYDRRLESEDQPQTKPLHRDHPYYGPDPVAMRAQLRDQPDPRRNAWKRFWDTVLGR